MVGHSSGSGMIAVQFTGHNTYMCDSIIRSQITGPTNGNAQLHLLICDWDTGIVTLKHFHCTGYFFWHRYQVNRT